MNAQDSAGDNALMIAAGEGNDAIVQSLLTFPGSDREPDPKKPVVDVNAKNKQAENALMKAATGGRRFRDSWWWTWAPHTDRQHLRSAELLQAAIEPLGRVVKFRVGRIAEPEARVPHTGE